MAWTKERVEYLDELSAKKEYSASQLASRISERFKCRVSRNAVINKMHRLGWSNRLPGRMSAAPKRRAVERDQKAEPSRDKPIRQAKLIKPPQPATKREGTSAREAIESLRFMDCRWPEGDPTGDNFRFCRQHRRLNSYYCDYHFALSRRSIGDEHDDA